MAKFTGNIDDFQRYIGPLTRNIVSNLSRKHKKHTTCSYEGCNKRKPLEAAHLKGRERPSIIAEILKEYQIDNDYYEIDLKEFESKFIEAHNPINEVIQPMCKKHHLEYDNKNNINKEYPILLNEFNDDDDSTSYSIDELIELENKEADDIKNEIKSKDEIISNFNLNKKQTSFSKVSESNGNWNFDVDKKKFSNDFYFIFLSSDKFNIAKIRANSLDLNKFLSKNNTQMVRFIVSEDFEDRHSGFNFKPYLL